MADTNNIIEQVESEIAASSTHSPTEAGHPESLPDPDLIDAINQVFALFQVNYHNQYFSAFGDNTKSENLAKKLWLEKLKGFRPEVIYQAAEKIIADSEYLPTLHKMLTTCQQTGMPSSLPNPRKAYEEACNAPSPKVEYPWSHPAVYLAARDCGWHFLANTIESVALQQYSDIYQQYCNRILAGESFTIEKPEVLPETSSKPADKALVKQQLDDLKNLLG